MLLVVQSSKVVSTVGLYLACVCITHVVSWSYLHTDEWGWECQKREKSPVNIDTTSAVYDDTLRSLTFKNYDLTTDEVQYSMVNNGHSLEVFVRSNPEHNISISGATLQGNYMLEQFHFHWGNDSSTGSEHMIDGVSYPLELHLVHRNVKYGSTHDATLEADGVAVLAVLFKITGPPHHTSSKVSHGMQNIIHDITRPEIQHPNQGDVKLRPFKMSTLLPSPAMTEDHRVYYHTVPCTDTVTWYVFRTPLEISESYLQLFRQLINIRQQPMVNNYRQVQPLHQPTVYKSYTSATAVATYTACNTYITLMFIIIAVAY